MKTSTSLVINRQTGKARSLGKIKQRADILDSKPKRKARSIDADNLLANASKFGVSVSRISKLLASGDTERAVGILQRKMLDAIVNVIPIAEQEYKLRPTQSQAYALNGLVSQARELAHDIQNTGDRQKLAITLVQEIIMPAFREVAQAVIDEHYALRKRVDDKVNERDRARVSDLIDQAGQSIARAAADQYKTVANRITESITK